MYRIKKWDETDKKKKVKSKGKETKYKKLNLHLILSLRT